MAEQEQITLSISGKNGVALQTLITKDKLNKILEVLQLGGSGFELERLRN